MRQPLRVGVIGAAYAAVSHLPALAALPEYDLVAVATSRPDTARAAAEKFGIPRAVTGFEALCADPDIDLVCVATRPSSHADMVLAAVEAGKHVLCEVPLAPTVAAARRMCAAVSRSGLVGAVAMQSRFAAGLWRMRELVRDGWLGTVRNVHATAFYPTFTRPDSVRAFGWCAYARHGASSLRVHGLHTADLVRWMFGEFDQVSGVVATRHPMWPGRIPASSVDSAVLAGTVDGAPCSIHTSWVARLGTGWRLEAHGSDGYLEATADGHTGGFPVTLRGARAGRPLEEIPSGPANQALTGLLCRLATAVAGEPDADLPTFADGLAMLRLAEAVETSASRS